MLQQSFPARRWLLFIVLLAVQGCSQGKYIYWKKPAPMPEEAVTGLLAYQYIALNQVADEAIADYCLQLTALRSPGYQLFLLQLSCAERWLAQPLDEQQRQQQALMQWQQQLHLYCKVLPEHLWVHRAS